MLSFFFTHLKKPSNTLAFILLLIGLTMGQIHASYAPQDSIQRETFLKVKSITYTRPVGAPSGLSSVRNTFLPHKASLIAQAKYGYGLSYWQEKPKSDFRQRTEAVLFGIGAGFVIGIIVNSLLLNI